MLFFYKHWPDIGGCLAVIDLFIVAVCWNNLTGYQIMMWLNLVTLFLHQLEEYRWPGTFPGMLNERVFDSAAPDHYPLNTRTAFLINVLMGWLIYFLAACFAEKAVWLGMIAIFISGGNIIAHTFFFNIKGKTFYNAGIVTSWLLFMPAIYFFFQIIYRDELVSSTDYLIAIPLGIIANLSILLLVKWLSNKNSSYIFPDRNLLRKNRKGRMIDNH